MTVNEFHWFLKIDIEKNVMNNNLYNKVFFLFYDAFSCLWQLLFYWKLYMKYITLKFSIWLCVCIMFDKIKYLNFKWILLFLTFHSSKNLENMPHPPPPSLPPPDNYIYVCTYIHTHIHTYIHICYCGSVVEHCVSSAKGHGFNSQGKHSLTIIV